MKLSDLLTEAVLDERKAFLPGTVRKRADGQYIKTHRGDWERLPTGADPASAGARQQDVAKTKETVGEFAKKLAGGEFEKGWDLGAHVRNAKGFLARHNASLVRFQSELEGMAGPTGKVKARTKKLESALGKMVRKPKYKRADMLQDGTGARIIHQSIAEVQSTVEQLRKKYRVVEEDDYITKPHPSDPTYRSHHLIVEDEDGLQKEIQVRTANQNKFADWNHNVYKPLTRAQADLVSSHKNVISAYAKAYSDHVFSVDSGDDTPVPKPKCPDEVRAAVGCLD